MNRRPLKWLSHVLLFLILCSLSVQACSPSSSVRKQPPLRDFISEQNMDSEAPIGEFQPPEGGSTIRWIDNSLLVYIPPGEFVMGNDRDDSPTHPVYLDGFWIYRTEVTYSMYLSCMAEGLCSPPAYDPTLPNNIKDSALADMPIVGLRWDQAAQYCEYVDGALPSEAQWEKTARGTDSRPFPWGNDEPSCDLLNFNDCRGETSPVSDYLLGFSPYEVLDMAGNVFEWVRDWYLEDYYNQDHFDNPLGPEYGEVRSIRGSSFMANPDGVESALRYYLEPDEYRNDLGFRCVVGRAELYAPQCGVLAHSPSRTEAENPDEAPGGSASCLVPQPEISEVYYCYQETRNINISWTPADAEMDYSNSGSAWCAPYDADTLVCYGDPGAEVNIKVCKSCPPPQVELGLVGSCDPPYVIDTTTEYCMYAGPPVPDRVRCAPGYSLSDDESCCVRDNATPLDFPVCPVGGVFDPVSSICWFTLPSTGDEKCSQKTIYFEKCPSDSNGDPDPDPCSDFKTVEMCNADSRCDWKFTSVGPGYCDAK
jgi:formylglycine-generating enzyme required for sulfatase activity